MNWVDLVILLILIAFAFHGWRRGFVLTALDVIGLVLAFALAVLGYPFVGGLIERLGLERGIANTLALVGIFMIVQAAFWALAWRAYRSLPPSAETSPANHALGVIPGLIKGALFVAVLILFVLNVPVGIPREAIEKSAAGRLFVGAASAIERSTSSLVSRDFRNDFTFITIEPGSSESVSIPVDKNAKLDPQAETEMIKLLNKNRVDNKLRPLKLDPTLQAVARAHSKDMFARGYFAHVSPDGQTPFDRMRKAKVKFTRAGENLALAPDASIAEGGLMKSPGHRRNILDPQYHRVGIGAYSAGPYRVAFSQEFAN